MSASVTGRHDDDAEKSRRTRRHALDLLSTMDHYCEAFIAQRGRCWRMVTAPDGTGHPTHCSEPPLWRARTQDRRGKWHVVELLPRRRRARWVEAGDPAVRRCVRRDFSRSFSVSLLGSSSSRPERGRPLWTDRPPRQIRLRYSSVSTLSVVTAITLNWSGMSATLPRSRSRHHRIHPLLGSS
jgi:hypothetical protein